MMTLVRGGLAALQQGLVSCSLCQARVIEWFLCDRVLGLQPGFPLLPHVCGPARAQVLPHIQRTEGLAATLATQQRAGIASYNITLGIFFF